MQLTRIAEAITDRMPALPPQLALGGRYLLDHPDSVVISSMREIAGSIGVAPATLVRLARALGYDDWSRLRAAYVDGFTSSRRYAERAEALVGRPGAPGLVEEVLDAQRAALQQVCVDHAPEDIDRAAALLAAAPRIFVASFMSCRGPGLTFAYICRLFRSNVVMLGEGGSFTSDLTDLGSKDAVLSINFAPYARDIHRVAEAVARSGATLVSIADSRETPLAAHAGAVMVFEARSPSFFPSLTPAMALVEALASAMLARGGEGAAARVAQVEAALYASGAYDDPPAAAPAGDGG